MTDGSNIEALFYEIFEIPDTPTGMRRGAEIAKIIMPHFYSLSHQEEIRANREACHFVRTALERCAHVLVMNSDNIGDSTNLRAAVSGCDAALTITPREMLPEAWVSLQVTRAGALLSLGGFLGGAEGVDFLQATISSCDLVLTEPTCNSMPKEWAATHTHRALAFWRLAERLGTSERPTLLQAAASGFGAALAVATPEAMPSNWVRLQMNRAVILTTQGDGLGGASLFNQAIAIYDDVLTVATRNAMPTEWARAHVNRASALSRLSIWGDPAKRVEYLQAAMSSFNAALTVMTSESTPFEWAATQLNRATVLSSFGGRTERHSDKINYLRAAISSLNAAMTVLSRDAAPTEWVKAKLNLASDLIQLSDLFYGIEAETCLKDAAEACEAALTVATHDAMPLDWAIARLHLSNIYRQLGEEKKNDEGTKLLMDAVTLCDAVLSVRSLETMPAKWAYVTMEKSNSLKMLSRRLSAAKREEALRRALEGYRTALSFYDSCENAEHRLTAARGCVECLVELQDWSAAIESGRRVLALGHAYLSESATEQDCAELTWRLTGLGDLTAFALVREGRYPEAVLAAEAGRVRQLRDHIQIVEAKLEPEDRERLTTQREKIGGLRRRYDFLTNMNTVDSDEAIRSRHFENLTTRATELRNEHRHLRELFDELDLGGQGIPDETLILRAASELRAGGAAVIIIAGMTDGVALVIPHGLTTAASVQKVDLPGFCSDYLLDILKDSDEVNWLHSYLDFGADLQRTKGRGSASGLAAWNNRIAEILEILWTSLMAPIDTGLRNLGLTEGAEITLIVPSRLSFLPIHAAGTRTDGRWKCFFDRWSVAYAPCLSALAARKSTSSSALEIEQVLAVVDPLRDLNIHRSAARSAFSDEQLVELHGSRATHARVLAALSQADYACFDCHGRWAVDTDNSGLVLAGRELLSPSDILSVDMSRCRLAVLGACETAMGGVGMLIDEQHGLPLALLRAGVGAVAATFWPLFNTTAEAIVGDLFRRHRLDRLPPAAALRSVLLSIRDGAGPVEASMEARVAVWGEDDVAPPPESTAQEDAAQRALIQDLSQPIHWAVYAIFGG